MNIMEKVFKYDGIEVPVIKHKDEIWIKAVAVATILKYKHTMKSIRDHVDPKFKQNELFWLKMASESRGPKTDPPFKKK